jgi:adenylate cyclase
LQALTAICGEPILNPGRELGGQMRFVPNIRFGTDGFPETVARRLRATNIAAWSGAALTAFFAVWRLLDGSAHWKYAALVAFAYGLVPLLHRFGPLTAPLALVAIAYTWLFWITSIVGFDSGNIFFILRLLRSESC